MGKIILSRKGFDTSTGGKPNVIYNNNMISFPIPEAGSGRFYNELSFSNTEFDYLKVMRDLGINFYSEAHLDPDIYPRIIHREKNWKGVFGQHRYPAKYLVEKKEIDKGDIFLFFGWFKEIEIKGKNFRYIRKKTPLNKDFPNGFHAIFGFLEVGKVIEVGKGINVENDKDLIEHQQHPHVKNRKNYGSNNTIFISQGKDRSGVLTFQENRELILSRPGKKISEWKLPEFFKNIEIESESSQKKVISNHENFQMIGRHQEFVIDNIEIFKWAKKLINDHYKPL